MPGKRLVYCVWIDWTGNRYQVQPFLEAIVGVRSAGSGSFLAIPLNDVSWEFRSPSAARKAFERLKAVGPHWATYIRIRLMSIPPGLHQTWKTIRKYQRGKFPILPSLQRAHAGKSQPVIDRRGKRQKQNRKAILRRP